MHESILVHFYASQCSLDQWKRV